MVSTHSVDDGGNFRIAATPQRGLVSMATYDRRPPKEREIPVGTTGDEGVDFVLPAGQEVTGKVVDTQGTGMPNAMVQAHYHELGKPRRRAVSDTYTLTDSEGLFLLHNTGVDTKSRVAVLPRMSSCACL